MRAGLLTVAALIAPVAALSAAIPPAATGRLVSAAAVVRTVHSDIPPDVWSGARCVAVFPDLKKAAVGDGGKGGNGVMSCRNDENWGAPVFMQLQRGSGGLQIGASEADVVMLVMSDTVIQKLLGDKVSLGSDVSVAAGPVGRATAASPGAQPKAEILSYARSRGLFAGMDLAGSVLRPDEASNTDAYGAGATPRTILASRALSAPTEALGFLNALAAVPVSAAADSVRPSAAPAAESAVARTSPQTDQNARDLRGRIADMQRTIDRMLADAEPAPVGTTGAGDTTGTTVAGGARVSVERAQLTLLREQLDALARASDERR